MEKSSIGRVPRVVALAALAAVCGCGPSPGDGAPTQSTPSTDQTDPAFSELDEAHRGSDLWVPLSEVAGNPVVDSSMSNVGTAPALVSILSEDYGQLKRVPGPDGAGSAVEFPRYDATKPAPRAVLRITPAGIDDLAPGSNPFTFGADFRVDARAQGESRLDNGNNLLQRGLAGDASQFKLEVDKGRPACRIRGVKGQVDVKLDTEVEPGAWYRIRCVRDGDTVSVTLSRLTGGEAVVEETRRSAGPIGELLYLPSLPMSVGGKVRSSGNLVTSATDQFNGAVDSVVFDTD